MNQAHHFRDALINEPWFTLDGEAGHTPCMTWQVQPAALSFSGGFVKHRQDAIRRIDQVQVTAVHLRQPQGLSGCQSAACSRLTEWPWVAYTDATAAGSGCRGEVEPHKGAPDTGLCVCAWLR
jgi:hypothetical protein